MKVVTLLLFIFTSGLQAQAGLEGTFRCRNSQFLKTPFELRFLGSEEGVFFSMKNLGLEKDCPLSSLASDGQRLLLSPIDPENLSCSLKNWSRPDTNRSLVEISISNDFLEREAGYVKVKLDNSMAEFGSETITSFVYCKLNQL